jgi:hypothetical protein
MQFVDFESQRWAGDSLAVTGEAESRVVAVTVRFDLRARFGLAWGSVMADTNNTRSVGRPRAKVVTICNAV